VKTGTEFEEDFEAFKNESSRLEVNYDFFDVFLILGLADGFVPHSKDVFNFSFKPE